MRSESTPFRRGSARGTNRSVDVSGAPLRDRSQLLTIRGIDSVEIFSAHRLLPGTADEMSKTIDMALQPYSCLFGIFRSGSVLHADKLFGNAHLGFTRLVGATYLFRSIALCNRMSIIGRVTSGRVMLQLPLDVSQ